MSKIFLPHIARNVHPTPRLGTFVEGIDATKMSFAVPGQSIGWLANWSVIQQEQDFLNMTKLEAAYQLIGDHPHWIQVKNSPPWAQSIEGLPCSPPKREYWEDFADFVVFIIDWYRPFMVEIWNEPEPKPEEIPTELIGVVGCWGDGTLYGEFVKYVYNYVKPANPDTIIAGGALMLNSQECWEFTEDFLKVAEMDVLSFHSYPIHPWCNYDDPLIKAQNLRKLTNKPLWLTETSYKYAGDEPDEVFEQCQADYLRYVYNEAGRVGIEFVNWYTLANNGWRHTDLVEDGRKKLAWYAFEKLVKG